MRAHRWVVRRQGRGPSGRRFRPVRLLVVVVVVLLAAAVAVAVVREPSLAAEVGLAAALAQTAIGLVDFAAGGRRTAVR